MPRISHNHSGVAANHSVYQTSALVDSNTILEKIATNTENMNVNVDTLEVSVDALEVLQAANNATTASIDTRLDNSIGAVNNSDNLGDGSSQLRTISLGYDRSGGKARSILVDSGGITQVHDSVIETTNNSILAKNGEIESSLNSLITANHSDLIALEATSELILAKNTEIEATADLILAKNTEVESSLNSLITANHTDLVAIEATADLILAKNTEIEATADLILAKNTEVESSLNSLITANHTDLVAIEATADLILAKNTEIEATADLILAKNTEVESSLNSLITANHTDLVAIEATADLILAKNTEIESTANSILSKNTELEAELGLIKQAVQLIDNAVDGDYLNVNQNIAGTDVSSNSGNKDAQTQRFCLATDDVPTGLTNTILNAVNGSVGTGNATLLDIKTAVELLDNALDGNYLNVNANIGGADLAVNSGNKDSATQRVVIATDDVPFQTLNTHLSEIEDAVETLQACVDSNKVKVQFEAGDLNIGNVDVASSALPSGASTESSLTAMSAKLPASLGPKGNGASISTCRNSTAGAYDMTGRTTIGTPGSSTHVLVDAAGHLQVDVLSGGGSTDVSAVATHAKQDVIIGHIDGIEGLIGTTNSGLSSIDSGITDIDGLITDGNALLTAIDSDTNNIKTAVETLAGAVDGNGANAIGVRSDVYFQGVASETNSGNKNDNCQRVVLATDDIPLATANAKLVEIETTANSILAKNTEIESTADGILAKNTEIETTANSILAKNTEMETSLNSILSKNGEIESSMNSLISANHTDLVALEATLTEIAPRQATAGVYSNASLADDGISSVIDTDDYSFMTICASQGSADLPLEIQYSINNSNWFKVRSKLIEFAAYEGGSWADIVLEHPFRYVRFVNTSGSTITTLYLSYQLSN